MMLEYMNEIQTMIHLPLVMLKPKSSSSTKNNYTCEWLFIYLFAVTHLECNRSSNHQPKFHRLGTKFRLFQVEMDIRRSDNREDTWSDRASQQAHQCLHLIKIKFKIMLSAKSNKLPLGPKVTNLISMAPVMTTDLRNPGCHGISWWNAG